MECRVCCTLRRPDLFSRDFRCRTCNERICDPCFNPKARRCTACRDQARAAEILELSETIAEREGCPWESAQQQATAIWERINRMFVSLLHSRARRFVAEDDDEEERREGDDDKDTTGGTPCTAPDVDHGGARVSRE